MVEVRQGSIGAKSLGSEWPGQNPSSGTYLLCELEQATNRLCASIHLLQNRENPRAVGKIISINT